MPDSVTIQYRSDPRKPPRQFQLSERKIVTEDDFWAAGGGLLSSVSSMFGSDGSAKLKQEKDSRAQVAKYNVTIEKGGMKKFKDGKRFDASDKICKRRYSLIYVTAL